MSKRRRGGKFSTDDLVDEEEESDQNEEEDERRSTRSATAKAAARTSDTDVTQRDRRAANDKKKKKKAGDRKRQKRDKGASKNGSGVAESFAAAAAAAGDGGGGGGGGDDDDDTGTTRTDSQFGGPPPPSTPKPSRRLKQPSVTLPSYGETVEITTKYLHFPDGEIAGKKRFPTTTVGKPPDQELDMVEVKLRVDYRLANDKKKLALSDNGYVLPPIGEKFADELDLSSDRGELMAAIDTHLKLRNLVTDNVRDPGRTIMIRRNEYKGSRKTTQNSDPLEPLPLGPFACIGEIPLRKFEIYLKPRTPEPVEEIDDSDSSSDDDDEESSDSEDSSSSSSSEGSGDKPSVNEDGSGESESPSDDSSSGGSDYQEEVGPNRSTGSGRRAGSKVGKGKQDDKKSWIEKGLAYQKMYDEWERQP